MNYEKKLEKYMRLFSQQFIEPPFKGFRQQWVIDHITENQYDLSKFLQFIKAVVRRKSPIESVTVEEFLTALDNFMV